MALGQELKEFAAGFQSGARTGAMINQQDYYDEMRRAKSGEPVGNAEYDAFMKEHGATLGMRRPGLRGWFDRQFGRTPMTGGATYNPGVPGSWGVGAPTVDDVGTYSNGGVVRPQMLAVPGYQSGGYVDRLRALGAPQESAPMSTPVPVPSSSFESPIQGPAPSLILWDENGQPVGDWTRVPSADERDDKDDFKGEGPGGYTPMPQGPTPTERMRALGAPQQSAPMSTPITPSRPPDVMEGPAVAAPPVTQRRIPDVMEGPAVAAPPVTQRRIPDVMEGPAVAAPPVTLPQRAVPIGATATPPKSPAGAPTPGGNAPAPSSGGASPTAVPTGGRKRLRDQTRTEAFDENLDRNDPDNVLKDIINGGVMYATNVFDLGKGAPGANGQPTQGDQRGAAAFAQGVGAASPQDVGAIDNIVRQVSADRAKLTPAQLGLRRLEIVYRHYVQTGQTDKANKAAFEMLQYSAGEVAKMGHQALEQMRTGDWRGGVQTLIKAYDQVPDGQDVSLSPDGKAAIVTQRGKVVQQIPVGPREFFNAALGLANRSMYWDLLARRAAQTPAMQREITAQNKAGLDEKRGRLLDAQIELTNKRTANVGAGRGRGGGAPAAPIPQGLQDQLDKIEQNRVPRQGGAAGGGSSQPPNPSVSGGTSSNVTTGGDNGDDLEPTGLDAGGKITQAASDPGTPDAVLQDQMQRAAQSPPVSVAPAAVPSPSSQAAAPSPAVPPASNGGATAPAASPGAAAPKFDPDGDGYDREFAIAGGAKPDATGHWPSVDPKTRRILKGRKHETFNLTLQAEDNLGNEVYKGKDGFYYTRPKDPTVVPDNVVSDGKIKPRQKPVEPKFEEAHPLSPFDMRNPYAAMLADPKNAAYFASREGRQLKSGLTARKQELDKDVTDWNKRRAEFLGEARREQSKDETNKKERARGVYDRSLSPKDATDIEGQVTTQLIPQFKEAADKENRRTVFNDGTAKDHEIARLAIDIATSNKNGTPQQAMAYLDELTRAGDKSEERDWRAFVVRGRDDAGNVVITLRDDPTIQLHLRENTFKKINAIVDRRHKKIMEGQAAPPSGWAAAGNEAAGLLRAIPEYMSRGGAGPDTPLGDATRMGVNVVTGKPIREAVGATGRAIGKAIVGGRPIAKKPEEYDTDNLLAGP